MPNWWEVEPDAPPQASEFQRRVAHYSQLLGVDAQQQTQGRQVQGAPQYAATQQQQQRSPVWQPPGFMDLWRQRLQEPAPGAPPTTTAGGIGVAPSSYAPPVLPPGAPEYGEDEEAWQQRGEALGAELFPWWGEQREEDPLWMQRVNRFIELSTARGLGRTIRAWERPEDRALLGGEPEPIPEEIRQAAPTFAVEGLTLFQMLTGKGEVAGIDPEEYRVLLDPVARMRAVGEARKGWAESLERKDPLGIGAELGELVQFKDPLGIGTALAELSVSLPAVAKAWEALTYRSPMLRRAEQFAGVGAQLLQEPAIGLEELTGATAIMARPESRDLSVEQWYPLTTRTWSLVYDQAKARLGFGPRADPEWGEDVLGGSLLSIADGTATADQIALARESLGAEFVGQMLTDPLNLDGLIFGANKVLRGKHLSAAEVRMLGSAADNPKALRALATLERALSDAGMTDVSVLQDAAKAAGVTLDQGTLGKFADVATKPFQLTPEAKSIRDLNEISIVLTPALELAESGEDALQLLRMWADDPASLAPMFGRVPQSLAGKKASVVLGALVDHLEDLPSFQGDYNPVRAWLDVDQLAHEALRMAHGYTEPGRVQRFFLAYKRLMSEFYLNASFSPGYVIRNTLGDGGGMATDGLLTLERADVIDEFMGQFGDFTTRRLMTEGTAAKEAMTGAGEITSILPGVAGEYSKAGQRFTRFAEPLGRLPLGEESRYKRAVYMALKRFWNENAPGLLPDLPDIAKAQLGDQAEHLRLRIAYEADLAKSRQAVTEFLEGAKGKQFEPTMYVDPEDLDAMSPTILRKLRDGWGDFTEENTTGDLQGLFREVMDAVDEDEAARLAAMEDLPARVHVTTDVDEAEIADEFIDELEEIVATTGDEKQARRVEEIKEAIPKVEEALDTARREAFDDLLTDPSPDGLEILMRANADAEQMRDEWRQVANKLRREAKAAYDAEPLNADQIWTDYFQAVDEGWADLARRRIERFHEAREQVERIRHGETLGSIFGRGARHERAESWILKASEIPEKPKGFLPGRVLRSDEDDKFEKFLAWHRAKLDKERTNAWRAVYGTEPEDYGKTLDLLDSADRDVEQFGKATAGRVRELYRQAEAQAQKAMRMHKTKAARSQAVDAVWEKYYILRNDAWSKYWDAAEQRWKIAERDILWGNWSRGPRMEPPAPMPPAPDTGPTPTQAGMPMPGAEPVDEDLVKAAVLKADADWTPEEKEAIKGWVRSGRELPEVQPSIFPGADLPTYTRDQFLDDLKGISGIGDEQAESLMQLTDAAADVWSKRTGRAPEEWYRQYLGGVRRGDEPAHQLFQQMESVEAPEFGAWFAESKAVDAEGNAKTFYHGSAQSGFEAFDASKTDPYALYGPGFYFTDAPDVAGGYAGSEGVLRLAGDPENILPKLKAAAEAVEHPEVGKARLALADLYDEWDNLAAQITTDAEPPRITAQRLDIERRIKQATDAFDRAEKAYGQSPSTVNWELLIDQAHRFEDPYHLHRALRSHGIPTEGIIDQLGAPGIYPVYMSVQNPFDVDGLYSADEFLQITGRQPPSMVGNYKGQEVYDTLVNRGHFEHAGEGHKAWANTQLKAAGFDGITHIGGKITGGQQHKVMIAFEPDQVKGIFNQGDWAKGKPHLLYQQGAQQGAKGAVDFLHDGRALFSFFEGADISTGLHEIGHVFRRTLPSHDLARVEKWAGLGAGDFERLRDVALEHQALQSLPRRSEQQAARVKQIESAAKKYTAAEEKWARGFERYLAEGSAPAPELENVFQRFKEWLIDIYRQIVGTSLDVDLNDEIRGVMDRLLAENPAPRAGDPWGQELAGEMALTRRHEVAQVISGARGRDPLDVEDAARMFRLEDRPDELAEQLERIANNHAELADREALRAKASKAAHGTGEERWEWTGWRAGKSRQEADLPTWEQGKVTRTKRVQSKKWEQEEYWRLQGIDPDLPVAEKKRLAAEGLDREGELAGWYYALAEQARNLARGEPPGDPMTMIPEWVAQKSLGKLEQLEELRQADDLDEILEQLGYRRADIWPDEAGAPTLYQKPQQMGMFQEGEDLPLFSGTAPRAQEQVFQPGLAGGQVSLPGMEPAMGDAEKYAARAATPIPEPAEWVRAKERYNQLFGLPPEQIKYFDELTPAQVEEVRRRFSLHNAEDHIFAVRQDGSLVPRRERRRPMWEPETPRPEAPGTPPPPEELRPQRVPKGQATLWQKPEQTGFWMEDPDNWREYIKALNEPGATAGPLPADILQRSTEATRRALRKIEEGMTRDWDRWRRVAADNQAHQALDDWFNQQVVPSWYENRAVAYDYATAQADFSLYDYAKRRNFDTWMAYIFPYHYWFTRAGKNWAQRLARRPGMLSNYVRARDAMKLANQQAGRRRRFEDKVRIPFPWLPDWAGDAVYVDPVQMVLPFAGMWGTNWDDADESKQGLRKIYEGAQRFGLRPYHIWEYLYQTGAFQKAGELAGLAPGPAEQLLGPEYRGNFPYILPQTGLIKGVTSLARELGAEQMPPGGVNIEAPLRQAIGLPAGEIWDPYRTNRMLANLSAEQAQNPELAQTALRAQQLVEADEQQTGKVWDPSSELAQQVAAEYNWTPEQLSGAQELLADAMQKAGLERGIGTLGWLAGPQMAIEPRGERAQLEMAEQARGTVWSPEQPGGSREAYEQFKREHPAMYPRSTQYNILPGEKEYEAMPPGARANWLILRNQKEMLHEEYDLAVDTLLRTQPWNWDGRNALEDERRAALAELDAKYPMPEMTGDLPAILYGMNPDEMWDGTVEKELYRLKATKPDPGAFDSGEGVDWSAYYKEETKWRARLPRVFAFGIPQGGQYDRMDPATAMRNFEQRYDSPLEAAYKTYQREVASPAWERYNATKDYAGTVGMVEQVPASALIPAILARYQTKGWTEEQLRQELAGVVFPSLSDQQDLKKGQAPEAADTGTTAYQRPRSTYKDQSPEELQASVQRILAYWNAKQGRYSGGGGGGGGGSRYTPRYSGSSYPRWRPPSVIRGGPFQY